MSDAADRVSQEHQDFMKALSDQERFQVLFQHSFDPILLVSSSGEIICANDSFREFTGIGSEEFHERKKSWEDFVAKEDLDRLRKSFTETVNGADVGLCEFRMIPRDGDPVWFEQRHCLVHGGNAEPEGFVVMIRNIHESKQLANDLRQTTQVMQGQSARSKVLIDRLSRFFTKSTDLPSDLTGFLDGLCGIVMEMYDALVVYVHIHESNQVIYRAREGVELGHGVEGRPEGLPTRMCVHVAETEASYVTGKLPREPAFADDPIVEKFGLHTYIGAPLRDSSGTIRGTLAILDQAVRPADSLDIELITVASVQAASRLRAEEQDVARRELEDHLRQAQKMEALGLLAGGVAHDFNNILSGILGFSSYLLNKVEPGSDLARDIGLIEKSAERASDLTRQLLAFARRKHFPKKPVSMNQVVEETLSILKRTLDKNIEIRTQLVSGVPNVLGDAGQLGQVIMNLCLNAAEAMMAKGGTLTVRSEVPSQNERDMALLKNRKDGAQEYVRVVISDTGLGMTSEVKNHIFNPFYTTKTNKGGSGLGLSIVYGIITNHGGDITVQSIIGRGSSFHVYLPVFTGDYVEPAQWKPEQLTGDETIFVVDDELVVRQMVTAVLKSNGYRVVTAASGEEAVDMFDRLVGRIDLVLLDMVMPGLNGEETFEVLRQSDPDLPVLLTSGFVQEDVTDRLLRKGAIGLVYKPYKSETLLGHLREALDGAKR
jgi:PAS domain S-box-containing protein